MTGFGKRGQGAGPPLQPQRSASVPARPVQDVTSLDDPDEDKTDIATLMIAGAMGSVFLMAAGAVVYVTISYFPTGVFSLASRGAEQADSGYVSPLDATCAKGWTKDLPNGKQLKCYLTTTPERLCNKQERQHLIAVMKRYAADTAVWNLEFAKAGFGSILAIQSEGMKLGYQASKLQAESSKENPDPEKVGALSNEVTSIASGVMSGPDAVIAKAKDLVPQYELINDVKKLMLKGYISQSDFGWGELRIVDLAQREITRDGFQVVPACR